MKIDFKDLKLDVQYLDINLIKPFARNPRTHSKEQIQQIATSTLIVLFTGLVRFYYQCCV